MRLSGVLASAGRPVWLDITRLVERACIGTLTGIDRVELAYAETLLTSAAERTRFVMLGRWSGRFKFLPASAVRAFLRHLRQAWQDGRPADCRAAGVALMARAVLGMGGAVDAGAAYLLVSHRHLHRPRALHRALQASGAAFVPLIHDVIPLTFPEYGRPAEAGRHRVRMATVARLADGVVVNSVATGVAMSAYLPRDMRLHVAPLGVALPPVPAATDVGRPYFVCVGTIEPRKNHLLLLHLWRRLVARHGALAPGLVPGLVIVGRRGWENENVLDLLDRCPSLRDSVVELGSVSDTRLAGLLAGARALVMPSFAEGFGLPVAEALSLGVPVLCSDLPALREAGGAVPEYLDPLDSPAWEQAVLDYSPADSVRRRAQLGRLPGWRCATWMDHVTSVLAFAETIAARPVAAGARAMPEPVLV